MDILTESANLKLIALEEKSFELVRAGRQVEAGELLFGTEYQSQKKIYAEGMKNVGKQLDTYIQDSIRGVNDNAYLAMKTSLGVLPLLFLAWFAVFRTLLQWKTFIVDTNRQLDQLVSERTAQLEAEKMRSLSASKMATLGEMAGGIAHEINNPLGVIHGFSDFLIESISGGEARLEDIQLASQKIKQATERVSKIVNGLRSFLLRPTE